MPSFPNSFTEQPTVLSLDNAFARGYNFDGKTVQSLWTLQRQGLRVVAGLRRADVPALTAIAEQTGVREYCPKDIKQRWTDEATVEKQLAKNGGRAVFRLADIKTDTTAGFGWTGLEDCPELPKCETTFAVRISEDYRGQGLASPFTRAITFGSVALYGAQNVGLETWGSNTGAVKAYLAAGAELVTTHADERPTLEKFNLNENGKRNDVRLYMQFTETIR